MKKISLKLTVVLLLLSFFQLSLRAQIEELTDDGQTHNLGFTEEEAYDFIIPDGPYNAIEIELKGGDGGNARLGACESEGGDGATITATLLIGNGPNQFPVGTPIRVITGEGGFVANADIELTYLAGSGGGGSAILAYIDSQWEIIAVAGGGGGAYQGAAGVCISSQKGQGGRAGVSGGNGAGDHGGAGGVNGNGGGGGGAAGSGDLAGGGGGAFSNGKGNFDKEGKAGYPEGGAAGFISISGDKGGWGFGGGGVGEDAGGGGGGYSGGGGGGISDNGGGGGSYAHSEYATNSIITAGGASGNTENGYLIYQFKEVCSVEWTGTEPNRDYEYIENICNETDKGTIQMLYSYNSGTICASEFEWRIFPNNNYTDLGNGSWSNVGVGLHFVEVINKNLNAVVASTEIQVRPQNNQPIAKCKDVTVTMGGSFITVDDDVIDDGSTLSECDESLSFSLSKNTFSCWDIGENTVEMTVTGSNGYSSTCEAIVTIKPFFNGYVECREDFEVDLRGRESVVLTQGDIEVDLIKSNCAQTEKFFGPEELTCSDYNRQRIFRIELQRQDGTVASSCFTRVTVVDSSSPTAYCKEEVTVLLDENGQGSLAGIDVDNGSAFNNNCRDLSYYNLSQSEFDCSHIGDNEVTLTITNGYNNSSTCTSIVKVEKLEDNPPVASCQDLTIDLDINESAVLTPEMIADASTDDCGITYLSIQSGLQSFDCSHAGQSFEIIVSVEDNAANVSTCAAMVTIADPNSYCNAAPIALCQDITVSTGGDCQATISPNQLDGGSSDPDGDELTLSISEEGPFEVGDHALTLMVDDGELSSTCTARLTVEDNTAPTAICQDVTLSLAADVSTGSGTILSPMQINDGSNDACGVANLSLDKTSFDCSNVGDNTVQLTVTDVNGNNNSCTATVVVQDQSAPTARCTVGFLLDQKQLSLDGGVIAFETMGQSFTAGSSGTLAKVRMYLSSTVINGTIAPTLEIQAGETINAEAISSVESIPIATTQSTAEGWFDIVFTTPTEISAGNKYTIVLKANSSTGDEQTSLASRRGTGNTYPDGKLIFPTSSNPNDIAFETFMAEDIPVLLDPSGKASLTVSDIDGGSYDACGIASSSLSQTNFTCADIGVNNLTLSVTDINGNTSSCTSTVNVKDQTAPTSLCQDLTIQLDNNGQATITTADIDNGSNDACSIANLSLDKTNFDCSNVGDNTVTLTATDVNSNSNTCTATVTVEDNTAPVASCQDLTIQLDHNGLATITTADIDNGSNDACSIANLSLDKTNFDCSNVGDNTVTLTATDVNSNSSTCTATVTVEDNTAPVASCQDLTIQLDHNGLAAITATDIDNGSNDACSIANLSLDKTNFDCSNVGDNTVTLTATDVNTNSSTCQANVTVLDEIAPTMTCPQDMTVNTDQGECGAYVTLPKAAPADNCVIQSLQSRYRAIDELGNPADSWSAWDGDHSGFFELGAYEVQWRAQDPSDNEVFCSFHLNIIDEESPEVICTDLTVNFNGEESIAITSTSIFDEATSFDACGAVSFVSQSLTEVGCVDVGETFAVQVVGIDPNGNTGTCTAQVTVTGMPCNFEATDINCPNGAAATYNPTAESFTLTANDCNGYPDGEFSTVLTELCGDGEIIAKVASLIGDGRAGVIMMESDDPGARFVSKVKDLTPRTRTEYRMITDGSISNKSKNRSGVKWVRIVRQGPKFKTYTSTNGSYWRHAHTIEYETFANCIQVGLITYSKNANEPVTAVFDNVQVIGNTPSALEQNMANPSQDLQGIATPQIQTDLGRGINLNVAPNPFADLTQIEFTLLNSSDVTLEIYNLHGQRVQSLENARLDAGTHRYDWDGTSSQGASLPTGIYMLRLQADKKWFTTKVSLIHR